MRRTAILLLLALGLAVPAWAEPPPWARSAKTTVTKTADSEEIVVEVGGVKAGLRTVGRRRYELVWERDPRALGLRHRLHAHEIVRTFPAERDPLPTPGATVALGDAAAVPDLSPVTVDVNYFYSAAAAAAAGGEANMPAFMALTCALTNQSYANSGLGHITWRCLGPFKASYVESSGDGLAWLAGAGAPEVAAKYALTGADLTHLVVAAIPGGWCGFGYMTVGPSNALSESDRSCTNSNLSGPHEMGHNVGFDHDPANAGCTLVTSPASGLSCCGAAGQCTGFNYGHSWPIGAVQWRDIMAYPGAGGTRITQVSNPAVLNHSVPTGVPNERDNARVAVARAPVVAQFRVAVSPPPPPSPWGAVPVVLH